MAKPFVKKPTNIKILGQEIMVRENVCQKVGRKVESRRRKAWGL